MLSNLFGDAGRLVLRFCDAMLVAAGTIPVFPVSRKTMIGRVTRGMAEANQRCECG